MLRRLFSRVFRFRLRRIRQGQMVIEADYYKKLLQDSLCYHKLYRKVEQLNREHFLSINLNNFRPIDTVEIPDYLPEDL